MFRDMEKFTSPMFSNTSNFNICSMESEFLKNRANMGSDLFQQQSRVLNQQSNLIRYRSAPNSFFAGLVEDDDENNNNNNNFVVTNDGSSSSDSDTMFSALLNCNGSGCTSTTSDSRDPNGGQMTQIQFQSGMKEEVLENVNGNRINSGYESGGVVSNLIRQSSSPAGFFSGFDVVKEVGNFRASTNGGANGEATSSTNGFNNHINYSSAQTSSSNFMPSIAENESWNESSFNCLKRNKDGDIKMLSNNNFNGLNNQNGESRNYPSGLTQHLSLPKTSAAEKFMQFHQDSVPCKIRAKRGFATHPRSIAERMRRTRISERMKKLQELFPDMDKQANTADMLDLAVEYIKDLQKKVETLTDKKAKCMCPK